MRLRPWVKVTLAFVIGVIAVSQVFKITGSQASSGKRTVFHAVIEMNLNGESHIKHLDGGWDEDVKLKTKEEYMPMQIVTVVVEDGEVINDYATEGEELDKVIKKNEAQIAEYHDGIKGTTNLYYK
ncbi:hypothetical protein CN984_12590 [Bacillus cereus]|uniref:Uncharacterized protein n=1 Tax=Bacillus cereus TaxID=1396 RepID=A0A2A7FNZ1_BACCE|nr:hypothetical protein [Bacillus cereus]PEA25903.1 hypothetical protein CON44_18365 [Bacillus cereus]PGO29255.1 hypothetical protein CN984_12590 [Bacillus cereus]